MTVNQRFYYPNLTHHIRVYITGYHICQKFKEGNKLNRPFLKIKIDMPAPSKISMDIMHIPCSTKQ